MVLKAIKYGVLGIAGAALAGGLLFGSDLCSYARSGGRSIQAVVKDNVPIEFELRRARDLVDDIVPEMQANVRLIAQQEVEIADLRGEIERSQRAVEEERARVDKLRTGLSTPKTSFTFNRINYSRDQVKEELGRRFDGLKEAEIVLTGKQRLLSNRERSLAAAVQAMDRMRGQKSLLESQIAALDAQHRLVQAASVGSSVAIDNTKLAQTERLIAQIKKQLDVAERVLAHESRFVTPIQVDAVSEADLLREVDEHFAGDTKHVENDDITDDSDAKPAGANGQVEREPELVQR
jgi:predicted  nucleic acid-binding Zn-ribbon protein